MNPLSHLIRTLDRLGIPYLIGGSHAAAALSIGYWSTQDVDIVAAISGLQADRLSAELGQEWYADAAQMREAIARGWPFNLLYIPLADKFDVFPAAGDFELSQLGRAAAENVQFGEETITCRVATAEDILLAKLRWYRDGREVSERQWNDIAGIVAANASLDLDYLRNWAARLAVADLLARALKEHTA